jgi:hypothetical protein
MCSCDEIVLMRAFGGGRGVRSAVAYPALAFAASLTGKARVSWFFPIELHNVAVLAVTLFPFYNLIVRTRRVGQ